MIITADTKILGGFLLFNESRSDWKGLSVRSNLDKLFGEHTVRASTGTSKSGAKILRFASLHGHDPNLWLQAHELALQIQAMLLRTENLK